MTARVNNRWTPELLAQCRRLYEEGASNQVLAAMFDIKPATVSVMAWQREWRRERQPRRAGAKMPAVAVADEQEILNPSIPPTRMETAFNTRLCRMIRAYWRTQGKGIELTIETMSNGLQCIRSRSVNGMPLD